MKIKTSEWLVGFGLWAGAWAMFNLLSGILFELQVGLLQENGPNQSFVSVRDIPLLGGALVLFFTSTLTVKSHTKLLVLFSVFSALFLYSGFVYWLLYKFLCEGPNCVTTLAYQAPFSNIAAFDWQSLGNTVGGYCVGWLTVVAFARPESRGRRIVSSILKWLQVDTKMYAKFWRWWLSLPLWTYAPTVKVGLRLFWIGVCCVAATEYIFGGINSILGSYGYLVEAYDYQDNARSVFVYAYSFTVWSVISYAVGRVACESGFKLDLIWLLLSGVAINLFELSFSLSELENVPEFDLDILDLYSLAYLPVSLVLTSLFIFWGMQRASNKTV